MELNSTKDTVEERTKTTNLAGGEAYEPDSPQMALYKVTINNLLEDKYYQDDEESLKEVVERFYQCAEEDAEFPLKLAAYARDEMGLRDISQVLLVLSSYHEDSKQYVDKWASSIVVRADEPATVVAAHDFFSDSNYHIAESNMNITSTIPAPLRRGINDALHNFDGYQFAKYDTDRREVNLRDVLNRTHPEPQDDEHEELFERLMLGDLDDHPEVDPLEPPETWEVIISDKGSTAEAWRSVIDRMGLFATIRNIRNMKQAGLDSEEILDEDDLEYVEDSRMFPFRFYQSYRAVKKAGVSDPHIEDWLSEAINKTAKNVPDNLSNTVVGVDLSGSMDSTLSDRSEMTYKEISSFFGAILKRKGARVGGFGDDLKYISCHHRTPTLEIQDKLLGLDSEVGNSTNGWKVIRDLRERGESVDRIVLLTDMQIWDSTQSAGWGSRGESGTVKEELDKYRSEVNPDAALYLLDLSSYGDLVTPEGYHNVFNISGWNSRILDFIEYAENPRDAIQEVEAVEPRS